MHLKWLPLSMLFFLACAVNVHPAEFYQGKTIRVIVGGSAGGGFDIYTRAMARHMGKHIPGNPTLIVENMFYRDALAFRQHRWRGDANA